MKNLNQFEAVECSCEKCVGYCEKSPGWFRPKEISPVAEFLRMTTLEAYEKYLIADFWATKEGRIYVLSPLKDLERLLSSQDPVRREGARLWLESRKFFNEDRDRAGGFASWGYAFLEAPCVFLKDGRCSIYSVRPFECRVSWHGNEDCVKGLRKLISREWRGFPLRRVLEDLPKGNG